MAAMMDEYMAAGHPPPPEALEMMMGPYGKSTRDFSVAHLL